MIKKHYEFTVKDFMLLKKIGRQKKSKYKDYDFANSVVFKPWGYEYLFYEGKDSCGWILHIKQGLGTSLHCHKEKKTLVCVISGLLLLITAAEKMLLMPGEAVLLDEKVFHSMSAFSFRNEAEDTRVIELEVPSDKTDSVRVIDYWKRKKQPYESKCLVMKNEL